MVQEKQFLKGAVVTVSGDFGKGKTSKDIERWVTGAGGKFVNVVSDEITHLICAEKDFKSRAPYGTLLHFPINHGEPTLTLTHIVKAAQDLGTVPIVAWDWLEDTLRRKTRLKETKYEMAKLTAKKARKGAKEAKRGKLGTEFKKSGSLASMFASHIIEFRSQTLGAIKDLSPDEPSERPQPVKTRAAVTRDATARTSTKKALTAKAAAKKARETLRATRSTTSATINKANGKKKATSGVSASSAALQIFSAHHEELKTKKYDDKPTVEAYTLFAPTADGSASTSSANHPSADVPRPAIGKKINANGIEEIQMIDAPFVAPDDEAEAIIGSRYQEPMTTTLRRVPTKKSSTKTAPSVRYSQTSKPTQPAPQQAKKPLPNDWEPVDGEHYHIYSQTIFHATGLAVETTATEPSASSASAGPSKPAVQEQASSSPAELSTEYLESDDIIDEPSPNAALETKVRTPLPDTHIERKVFEYNITLTRIQIRVNTNERFNLRIYESHKTPHEYACFLRYCSPKNSPVVKVLAPEGSTFDDAMAAFKEAFYRYTRKTWAEREDATKSGTFVEVNPQGTEESIEEEGEIAGFPTIADVKKHPFVYIKPKREFGANAVVMRFGLGRAVFG